MSDPEPVTVVGLGPMGQALARAFVAAGHPTTVWNRTPGRGAGLGVDEPGLLRDAVRAAPLVVVCLRDDDAVGEVLDQVVDELPGRALVDLTSATPHQARKRAAWADERHLAYVAGAILTPTPSIGDRSAVVLYSGGEPTFARWRATLTSALGGTARHLGDDAGRAAAHDVAHLTTFWLAVLGISHGLALARAEGIDPADMGSSTEAIAAMLPEMTSRFAEQLRDGEFPGSRSTVPSGATSLAHIVDTARRRRLDTGVLDAATTMLEHVVDAGHGDDGLARIARQLLPP